MSVFRYMGGLIRRRLFPHLWKSPKGAASGPGITIDTSVTHPLNPYIYGLASSTFNNSKPGNDPGVTNGNVARLAALNLKLFCYVGDTLFNWVRYIPDGHGYNSGDLQFVNGVNGKSGTWDNFADASDMCQSLGVDIALGASLCAVGSPWYSEAGFIATGDPIYRNQNASHNVAPYVDDINGQTKYALDQCVAKGVNVHVIIFGTEDNNLFWDGFYLGFPAGGNVNNMITKAENYATRAAALQTYLMANGYPSITYMWNTAPQYRAALGDIKWNLSVDNTKPFNCGRLYMNWIDFITQWASPDELAADPQANVKIMNGLGGPDGREIGQGLPEVAQWLDLYVGQYPDKKVGILQFCDSAAIADKLGGPPVYDIGYNNSSPGTFMKLIADARMYFEVIKWDAVNHKIHFVAYQTVRRILILPGGHNTAYTPTIQYYGLQHIGLMFQGNKVTIANVTHTLGDGINLIAFKDIDTNELSLYVINENPTAVTSNNIAIDGTQYTHFARNTLYGVSGTTPSLTASTATPEIVNETTLNIRAYSINHIILTP